MGEWMLLPAVGILLLVGELIGRVIERRMWNSGCSPRTGEPWKSFDMASDGSIGFKDSEGNCIWISRWGICRGIK